MKCEGVTMATVNLLEIGLRISERRKQLGFTQEQLSAWMDVSVQMISNLERGNKAIKIDNLVKLSRILEVSTDYILTGEHTMLDVNQLASDISGLTAEQKGLLQTMIDYWKSEKE